MILQINSTSSKDTESLAGIIGKSLLGSETIELISDLGGGKTTFVRGLVRGSGSKDHVSSPTFTIAKSYRGDKFTINHFDFYRLIDNPGIVAYELEESSSDPKSVTLIEWADSVKEALGDERLIIKINNTGFNSRVIEMQYPKSLEYLIDNIK